MPTAEGSKGGLDDINQKRLEDERRKLKLFFSFNLLLGFGLAASVRAPPDAPHARALPARARRTLPRPTRPAPRGPA